MITRFRLVPRLTLCAAAFCLDAAPVLAAAKDMAQRPIPPVVRTEAGLVDTCGQRSAQKLVGAMFSPQSQAALIKTIGHDRIRVIRPGAIITQDRRENRLNLIVDDAGRLMAARCG